MSVFVRFDTTVPASSTSYSNFYIAVSYKNGAWYGQIKSSDKSFTTLTIGPHTSIGDVLIECGQDIAPPKGNVLPN